MLRRKFLSKQAHRVTFGLFLLPAPVVEVAVTPYAQAYQSVYKEATTKSWEACPVHTKLKKSRASQSCIESQLGSFIA